MLRLLQAEEVLVLALGWQLGFSALLYHNLTTAPKIEFDIPR
jgi:hypothetical protein